MTKPSKSHAVAKAELSTDLVSPRDRDGALIDPAMTAVAKGAVEGAWSIEAVDEDWVPDEAFLLDEGEVKHVPPGVAIRVQSGGGWLHCEFPQSGGLYGPAVWAPAEATDPEALLAAAHAKGPMVPTGYKVWFAGCIGTMVIIFFHHADIMEQIRNLSPDPALEEVEKMTAAMKRMPYLLLGGIFSSLIPATAAELLHRKYWPKTIRSVNQRVSAVLRMPRSAIQALGRPQERLRLVSPAGPMDDLDQAIADSLDIYHAQRARLVAKKIAGSPMLEHTYTMLEEISLRIAADRSVLRKDNLRQTYLALIQRAEADVALVLDKKDTEAADALVGDMTALLRQMDSHRK